MNLVAIIAVVASVVSILGVISGIVLGWQGRSRSYKKDAVKETAEETSKDVRLQVDMEYIKRGVDAIQVEQKTQKNHFDELAGRVSKVEEKTDSAHKRIDRLDRIEDERRVPT